MIIRLAIILLCLCASAADAQAQVACAPRAGVIAQLEARFGEVQRLVLIETPSQVIEIWSNTDTGSWTVLRSFARGAACILLAGTGFNEPPERPAGSNL